MMHHCNTTSDWIIGHFPILSLQGPLCTSQEYAFQCFNIAEQIPGDAMTCDSEFCTRHMATDFIERNLLANGCLPWIQWAVWWHIEWSRSGISHFLSRSETGESWLRLNENPPTNHKPAWGTVNLSDTKNRSFSSLMKHGETVEDIGRL